jgi:hypothetical protein
MRSHKGANGAVYMIAPLDVRTFTAELAAAVGFTSGAVSLEGHVHRKPPLIMEKKAIPELTDELVAPWHPLSKALAAAAVKFKDAYGRPAVLIIDSAERIATKHSAFFADLQGFAKDMSEQGSLRLVFVFSDGAALEQMQCRPAWSLAREPVIDVGDISDDDAVKYLVTRNVPQAQADEAVRTITGGRFELLRKYATGYVTAGNAAARDKLYGKLQKSLYKVEVDERHEICRLLAEHNRVCGRLARQVCGRVTPV